MIICNKLVRGIVLMIVLALPTICRGQYVSHYIEKDRIKKDTLTDTITGNKFIIDKERIFITTINKKGKVLWKTDPFVDSKLSEYRIKRPTIVYFELTPGFLNISYNNSQFGYIEIDTGKFIFAGQD